MDENDHMGIENAPSALISLFRGMNLGKMLFKISPDLNVLSD